MKIQDLLVVNNAGFDGGGSQELGVQYHKLGINTIFHKSAKGGIEEVAGIETYKNLEEFKELVHRFSPKRVIFNLLDIDNKKYDGLPKEIVEFVKSEGMETIFIQCTRSKVGVTGICNGLRNNSITFDKSYALSKSSRDIMRSYGHNCEYIDINAYQFIDNSEKLDLPERKKIVLSSGRGVMVKGTVGWIDAQPAVQELSSDYYWVHEGFGHEWSEKDGKKEVSGSLSIVGILTEGIETKNAKPALNPYTSYEDFKGSLEAGKLNIFSTYEKSEAFPRWKSYAFAVCQALGRELMDEREYKWIEKNRIYWDTGIEYTNLEMIDMGLPTFFSKDYAKILGFQVEELIYEKYSDIPSLIRSIEEKGDYLEVYARQRKFFEELIDKTNADLIEEFLQPIGKSNSTPNLFDLF